MVEGIADGRLMNMNLATAAITTFYDTNAAITAPPSAFISSPDNWLFFGTGKLLVGNDVNISAQQSYYGTKVMDDGHMHVGTIENTTKTEATRTITGPVERLFSLALLAVPKTPENIPKKAANRIITLNLSVHCLAAAAGANSMALMSTTPTVCNPITIASTIKKLIKISINFVLNPSVLV